MLKRARTLTSGTPPAARASVQVPGAQASSRGSSGEGARAAGWLAGAVAYMTLNSDGARMPMLKRWACFCCPEAGAGPGGSSESGGSDANGKPSMLLPSLVDAAPDSGRELLKTFYKLPLLNYQLFKSTRHVPLTDAVSTR